jgi:hypothetical protein
MNYKDYDELVSLKYEAGKPTPGEVIYDLHRAITERDEVIKELADGYNSSCDLVDCSYPEDNEWITAIAHCNDPRHLSEVIKLALTLRKAEEAGDVNP